MIQRLLDTSEYTRPLEGLGLPSIGQRKMKILACKFALVIYTNVLKAFGIRSIDSDNPYKFL